jgi:hypothetical protein
VTGDTVDPEVTRIVPQGLVGDEVHAASRTALDDELLRRRRGAGTGLCPCTRAGTGPCTRAGIGPCTIGIGPCTIDGDTRKRCLCIAIC